MNDFLYGMFDERIKGVKPFETGLGRNEGGWGFNAAYYVEDEYKDDSGQTMTYQRRRSADEMSVCLADYDIDLKSTPFFGWFDDRTICTNAFLAESAVSRDLQSQLLADAIPAESLPAGLAEVPKWNSSTDFTHVESEKNINMAALCKDVDRIGILNVRKRNWTHSFFLAVPYMIVHGLFERITAQTQEGEHQQ